MHSGFLLSGRNAASRSAGRDIWFFFLKRKALGKAYVSAQDSREGYKNNTVIAITALQALPYRCVSEAMAATNPTPSAAAI